MSEGTGRILVTGCAGFIGSHLTERLLDTGHEVLGVDCFTDYYSRRLKESNLVEALEHPSFTFSELDLSCDPLEGLLDGVENVFHLAAQAGVRASFGEGFAGYIRHNIHATQRLLEEAARAEPVSFTYASSSSVYGDAECFPTTEETDRRPVSPYGMTKVATEELAAVYHRNFGVPVVGLRYFTVYGPRQRPDMAFCRFFERALRGDTLPIYGDGSQVRDFTYVDDVVDATIAAGARGRPGGVYNIGGGSPVQLRLAIRIIADLVGEDVQLELEDRQIGDARRTSCDGSLAERDLGFVPDTGLRAGLMHHLEWMVEQRRVRRDEGVLQAA
jgi:nucleoside-diphosphate-sugar epimerase